MIDSLTLSLFSWMLDDESSSSLECTSLEVDRIATELLQKNSFWCQRVQALLGRSTTSTMKESNWKSIYHALSLCTLGDELGLHQRVFTHLTAVVLLSERWQFSENMLTMACIAGTPEVVSFLLATMKDVSNQVLIDASSCWLVIESTTVHKTVPLLLADSRFDPGAQDNISFIAACKTGNLEVVKLLHADPRVDIRARGSIAFRCACTSGHVDVAKFLLEDPRITPADITEIDVPIIMKKAVPEMLELLGL